MGKQWVQHMSGNGEKYQLTDDGICDFLWEARNARQHYLRLPKSEYRLCDPPERGEDVTGEVMIDERSVWHDITGKIFLKPTDMWGEEFRLRKVDLHKEKLPNRYVLVVDHMVNL